MSSINMILSVPAIVAIVNLTKSFGVEGKWSLLAAVVVAVAINLSAFYFAASGAYEAVATGLLIGLSAAGLYDVTDGD